MLKALDVQETEAQASCLLVRTHSHVILTTTTIHLYMRRLKWVNRHIINMKTAQEIGLIFYEPNIARPSSDLKNASNVIYKIQNKAIRYVRFHICCNSRTCHWETGYVVTIFFTLQLLLLRRKPPFRVLQRNYI